MNRKVMYFWLQKIKAFKAINNSSEEAGTKQFLSHKLQKTDSRNTDSRPRMLS